MRFFATISLVLVLTLAAGFACAEADEGMAFFEKKIRPVLVEHCYECHSEQHGKRKGGLLLDTREALLLGGDSGPAVVPGEAATESLLLHAVGYADPDLEMPPDGALAKSLVADLTAWVEMGLPDPRDGQAVAASMIDIEAGRQHWAFQPISKVAGATIDSLVESETHMENRSPAMLLRRLHYDLTGLPPTVEELTEFEQAAGRDPQAAVVRLVDRLLASPEFGVRWGRHWLDITRYADSSGGGRAIPFPDAWRYRDYVIDSFSKDRPLNELITEHLAGDLLTHRDDAERVRHLVATGFLVLGPNNYENQNKGELDMEIVDEQLDTIGRAFLGMTIGCARCHDHKFDMIPATDYYALAGIFTSTQSVHHANVSAWHKETITPSSELKAEFDAFMEKSRALDAEIGALKTRIAALGGKAGGQPKAQPIAELPGLVLDNAEAELVGNWMSSTVAPRFVGENYTHDQTAGKGEKTATFRIPITRTGSYEVRLSYSASGNRATAVPATIAHAEGLTTFTMNQRTAPEIDRLFDSAGAFPFDAGDDAVITISNEGTADGVVIVDAIQLLPHEPETKPTATDAELAAGSSELADAEAKLKDLIAKKKKLTAKKPKLPTAMAVTDHKKPKDTAVRIRGTSDKLGEVVPRGFLQVVLPTEAKVPVIPAGASGRLELAEWITSAQNPLTARVLANRIWQHLMGEGIVASPDNFGLTGEAPSNPALLDHLASRLVAGGWSTKALVREIVLSETYQNHPGRRRLDAEAIRDTLLFLGANLDVETEGPSLPPGFKSEFGYRFKTLRRSAYLPVFRNTLHEAMAVFDFANPNFTFGKRTTSALPTQDLFLQNSPFVHQQADLAAKEIQAMDADSDAARVDLMFRRTLGRIPHTDERLAAEQLLASGDPNPWVTLQRALFASVDFRYLP